MWWTRKSQNEDIETPVDGHSFPMINKETGETEDVLVPFGNQDDYSDLIANNSHVVFTGTVEECFAYINEHPNIRAGNIASAYILPSGQCVLLFSHHHDQVARLVLPKALVPPTHDYGKELMTKVNSTHVPIFTGAIRVQLLPNGIGVMIDVANPPTDAQIASVKTYYDLTNGDEFVTEVNYNGELLAWLQSWPDFDRFLKRFKLSKEHEEATTNIREFLRRQDTDETWYGKEYRAKTERKHIVFT